MNPKEERILTEAALLFGKYGPRKATIDDIAKRCGVAKGTIYIYFKSKEEIFTAVCRREVNALLAQLKKAIHDGITAVDKLTRFLNIRFNAAQEIQDRYQSTQEIMEESRCFPELVAVKQEYFHGEIFILKDIIQMGIASGEFDGSIGDPELIAYGISAAMQGLEHPPQKLSDGRELSTEERLHLFTKIILTGLNQRRGD